MLHAPLQRQAVFANAVGGQGFPHLERVQHRGGWEHGEYAPLEGPGEGLHLFLGLQPQPQD